MTTTNDERLLSHNIGSLQLKKNENVRAATLSTPTPPFKNISLPTSQQQNPQTCLCT